MKHRRRLAPSQELEVQHGGAGDGTRTHKGFRPETCEVSAFTGFATPATSSATNPGNPEGQDARPHTRCRPRQHHAAYNSFVSIKYLQVGSLLRGGRLPLMTKPSPRLSKSRFTSGIQCHKSLWWEVH